MTQQQPRTPTTAREMTAAELVAKCETFEVIDGGITIPAMWPRLIRDRQRADLVAQIEKAVLTADRAASVAHDYMWPLSKDTAPTQKEASDAIWSIHEALRPLIDQIAAVRSAAPVEPTE